jgi:hypothetical protein
MSGPFVLAPITIVDAMVTSCTIAEPAAGETVWNAATNYTLGTEAILTAPHRVYENLIPGVSATSPDVAALQSTPAWLDKRATMKWASLDQYVTTQSQIVTPMTYVFRPGIFNAFQAYGLDGATLTFTAKSTAGGTVFFTQSYDLTEPPIDHYDYYFGRIKPLSKLLIKNILLYADPEITVTITAGAGVTVKAGMFIFGDLRPIISVDGTGGTQYDAQVKPTTTSLFIADGYGGTKIIRRTKGTDMDINVFMPRTDADSALSSLQDVLDVPVAWIGTDALGYAGLNVFGIASGSVKYAGPNHATMSLSVKGLF